MQILLFIGSWIVIAVIMFKFFEPASRRFWSNVFKVNIRTVRRYKSNEIVIEGNDNWLMYFLISFLYIASFLLPTIGLFALSYLFIGKPST
jgi:hypothetical protein